MKILKSPGLNKQNMLKAYWLAIFLMLTISTWSQSLTGPAGSAASQLPGNRAWNNVARATGNANATTSTAGVLNNGNPNTRVLALTNYNFAALPASITILGISATVTRSSTGGTARDLNIELIKGGVIQTAANRANALNWPATLTAVTYGNATDLWNNTWTRADIVSANFGIAISASRNGSNTTAAIDAVTITIYYSVVTPINLVNFDVKKSGAQALISFSTSSEDKVRWLIIERSSNGQQYNDQFIISPKGGLNIIQSYQITDFSPLPGTSYYRLKEIDIDGKVYYYETRIFNNPVTSNTFKAFGSNGVIHVEVQQPPGQYKLSLYTMNGILIRSEDIKVNNLSNRFELHFSEIRTGIYLLNLKGANGIIKTTRIFINQ